MIDNLVPWQITPLAMAIQALMPLLAIESPTKKGAEAPSLFTWLTLTRLVVV